VLEFSRETEQNGVKEREKKKRNIGREKDIQRDRERERD
jgi:hypothetical protein